MDITSANGDDIAAVVLGRTGPALGGGLSSLYLRASNDDQVWLAQGDADLSADPSDWVDDLLVDIRQERLMRIDILSPREGPVYAALRDAYGQDEPQLQPMPADRELRTTGSARTLAFALESIRFDAVRRKDDGFAKPAPTARLTTFDGITVEVGLVEIDDALWAAFDASFSAPETAFADDAYESDAEGSEGRLKRVDDARAEAEALRAAAEPWLFRLASFRSDRFAKPIEEMLKPLDE